MENVNTDSEIISDIDKKESCSGCSKNHSHETLSYSNKNTLFQDKL